MPLSPDAERRLAAKRANERIKLVYTTANAFAIGIVGAAFIVPGVSSLFPLIEVRRGIWLLIAAGLHIVAHLFIGRLRSED